MEASEVMGPHSAATSSVLSVNNPTRHFLCILMWLLFIFAQVLASLFFSAGVFIRSDDVLISPFRMCEMRCFPVAGAETEMFINFYVTVVILGLYVPVVLVAFSVLAMLFLVYTKDGVLLWVSMVCQAASSLLILTAIVVFLLLNLPYVAWKHMTVWFYTCVGVQVQLVITTVLTYVSRRRRRYSDCRLEDWN